MLFFGSLSFYRFGSHENSFVLFAWCYLTPLDARGLAINVPARFNCGIWGLDPSNPETRQPLVSAFENRPLDLAAQTLKKVAESFPL